MAVYDPLLRAFGKTTLSALGWKMEGLPPDVDHVVLICAPHTSNWDFGYMLLISWAQDWRVHWVGKESLFKPPFGPFMRWMGGISVKRGQNANQTQQVAERIKSSKKIIVAIAPEGTRGVAGLWKTGFYHIAHQSGSVIALGFLDYPSKRGGFGPPLTPSGDIEADFDKIRAFYGDKTGKFPNQQGPIAIAQKRE
jgi:1-acyl-sn-glycerol-3-phosphate acyltransferase